jgi:hypothetical protein
MHDTMNDREFEKGLEIDFNSDIIEQKEKPRPQGPESDLSDEGYESELEEIYTAYSCQFIRAETYNLFETQFGATKGLNIGKFGRF